MTGYRGPVVLLTLPESSALLAGDLTTPEGQAAAEKIRTALASDPRWKTPTR